MRVRCCQGAVWVRCGCGAGAVRVRCGCGAGAGAAKERVRRRGGNSTVYFFLLKNYLEKLFRKIRQIFP